MSVMLHNFVILKPDPKLIRQISSTNCADVRFFRREQCLVFKKLIRRSFITLVDFEVRFSEMCASGPARALPRAPSKPLSRTAHLLSQWSPRAEARTPRR